MHFQESNVLGAWVVDPAPHKDDRGRFMRAWCLREFGEHAIDFTPVQANMGFSARRGTIRGLHYQVAPALEAKLVRCTAGAIFDVVVDLRIAELLGFSDPSAYSHWRNKITRRGAGV